MKYHNKTSVIFLKRWGFDFYYPEKNTILKFNFSPNVVADLEIIDFEEFEKELKAFVEIYKINLTNLIIILSESISFKKSLIDLKAEEKEGQVKEFLNNVPFENIAYKILVFDKISVIEATNKDLYQTILLSFQKQGFYALGIFFASSILGKNAALKDNLDQQMLNELSKKANLIKADNLITKEINHDEEDTVYPKENKSNRLTILFAVFSLLVLILITLIFYKLTVPQNKAARSKTQALPSIIIIPTFTPTPTEIQVVAATESADLIGDLKIQIVYPNQSLKQVENIKKQLSSSGYKNIKTLMQNIASEKTTLIFSNKISVIARNKMYENLGKILSDSSIQEGHDPTFDLIIVVAR